MTEESIKSIYHFMVDACRNVYHIDPIVAGVCSRNGERLPALIDGDNGHVTCKFEDRRLSKTELTEIVDIWNDLIYLED